MGEEGQKDERKKVKVRGWERKDKRVRDIKEGQEGWERKDRIRGMHAEDT